MLAYFRSLDRKGTAAGFGAAAILVAGIVVGSRNLRDYDPVLLTYTFGVLFSAFAVAYRYAVWLQRPPTRVYWRRGWRLVFQRGAVLCNLRFLVRAGVDNLFAQRFIRRRSRVRWIAHFCFAWGCVIAGAVTFPLVFGWIHFETRADDPQMYQVVLFGRIVGEFPLQSVIRHVMFNLLNVSAVLVIVGVALALHRRFRDAGSLARQQFGNDLVPLILLLAISVTGLMLTFSTHALRGYGYSAISLIHALTVTATLLYLPFGKFFHIFQRPAQLSVTFYKRANESASPAACRVCGQAFAGAMHVDDLKGVLAEVGMDWTLEGAIPHYAEVCPRCRRRLLGRCQALAMDDSKVREFGDSKPTQAKAAAGGRKSAFTAVESFNG